MPQIKGDELKDALTILKQNGISVKQLTVDCSELKNSQSKVDKNKVLNIIREIRSGKILSPIIISRDRFVIDGHHRWIAYKLLKMKISCIMIDLPQKEALIKFKRIENSISNK